MEDQQIIEGAKRLLREAPTSEKRLEILDDITDEVCVHCGDLTDGYICYCTRDE